VKLEVAQHQRFGPDAAVHVGVRIQVPEARRRAAQAVERHLHRGGRQRAELRLLAGDRVLHHVVGQRTVGLAARDVDGEQHRQQYVARLGVALRQPAVGVERGFRFL
jgi:hypothetical protein